MPRPIAITGGIAITPTEEINASLVLIEEERLAYVGPREGRQLPPGAEEVDASGLYVFPGLIDTHVHGSHGDDVMLDGADGLRRINAIFPRYGCTAWLPSTISELHERILESVRWCVTAHNEPGPGADIVGIHVEGPYINRLRKGAQPEHGIRDPDLDQMADLLDAAEGLIRVVTLAPELPGGLDLVRFLVGRDVIASMGHSDADYETALAAIEAGATHATHLFNAMPPIHHRSPGLIMACLNEDRVLAEVIPDGVHLDPMTVRLIHRCKPSDAIALITDAMSAVGMPDGEYTLASHTVIVRGDRCTLPDGTLASSMLTMNRAVRNTLRFTGCSVVDAVRMASLIPARVAGCAAEKGSLEVGKHADVALMDQEFTVQRTYVRGRLAYSV